MNSYKCAQCGLVNWTTGEYCKRCQSPNPYLNQSAQVNNFSPNPAQTQVLARPMPTVRAMPDYSVPPPPNVFGASVGTMATAEGFTQVSPPMMANRPPFRAAFQPTFSQEDLEKLQKAEKEIRNAWISGVVVCAISLLVAILFSAVGNSKEVLSATPFEIVISVVIFGGLTIGVYCKSRACAVLLCGLFILDKIVTFASTGKFSGAILAFVFITYFAYGIQGTFAYHKLKQKGL